MRSIGQNLKDARMKKKFSLEKLADITKIRKEFIKAIENEEWEKLPDFPVIIGFVKSIAKALDTGEGPAAAMLKRDYPPKTLAVNPKPDINKEFVWSPRLTFFTGIVVVAVLLFGYLIYQYFVFVSPPKLSIEVPDENQQISEEKVIVSGKSDPEATVSVNNQPVLVDAEGNFSTEIEVVEETNEIVIIARSRSGKETIVSRRIEVKLNE